MTDEEFDYLTHFKNNYNETIVEVRMAHLQAVYDEKNNDLYTFTQFETMYRGEIVVSGEEQRSFFEL